MSTLVVAIAAPPESVKAAAPLGRRQPGIDYAMTASD
jgi:hypothetical protein